MPNRKTYMATPASVERAWHVVDVSGLTLGRAATKIAHVLRGKHKTTFTPHVDTGDFVIVVNAHKIHLTGKKWEIKLYQDHSLFPGGLTTRTAAQLLAHKPTELVRRAVWGMLPKGPLGRRMVKKLKIYAAAEHPHAAQKPTPMSAAQE
ncbi:MAG TPA: 50S ribosomal protein L13 [Polyangia bacterium]|nr:50S ribosomal protein L13 [Polyangia bacterium]